VPIALSRVVIGEQNAESNEEAERSQMRNNEIAVRAEHALDTFSDTLHRGMGFHVPNLLYLQQRTSKLNTKHLTEVAGIRTCTKTVPRDLLSVGFWASRVRCESEWRRPS
jgi:hypothetical protein